MIHWVQGGDWHPMSLEILIIPGLRQMIVAGMMGILRSLF
jgi:hypothetical protein